MLGTAGLTALAQADPKNGTSRGSLGDHWATPTSTEVVARGSIAGRFTTKSGKGIAKATVVVSTGADEDDANNESEVKTDSTGRFTVADLSPGDYKVMFIDRTKRVQYAYGKGNRAAANVFTVRSGQTTTVNDEQVAPATLRITAVNARTGKQLRAFCTYLDDLPENERCTKKSVVVIKNLRADRIRVSVHPTSGSLYLARTDLWATTVAGRTTRFAAKLQLGGKIDTTVVDRGTGRAVQDVCIDAMTPNRADLPSGYGGCTDANGRSRTDPLAPGIYNLFITTDGDNGDNRGGYGSQWVGDTGGTGDQRAAATITVRAGKVVSAPKARLDKAGSITGTVTTADGKPVPHGDASIRVTTDQLPADGNIDDQGRYTVENLGPYRWPLVFHTDLGRQWSGNKGNRYAATAVQVIAGKTATHNEVVHAQPVVTGTVSLRTGAIRWGRLTSYAASTGDQVMEVDIAPDGTFTMPVPGGERVKISYYVRRRPDGVSGWHGGAKTFAQATIVDMPVTGAQTLNFTVG
ncbi:MAG TPA: carboxypeptidase-like regulatory domain-containing protein [Actinoplanes sp.]|nr:carboxypeptidase-like regulatory domain-containing protein [Actinoplanes sp.]